MESKERNNSTCKHKKWSKRLPAALCAMLVALFGATAIACDNDSSSSDFDNSVPSSESSVSAPDSSSGGNDEVPEGPEVGAYYYDANGSEYQVFLNKGNEFTMLVGGEHRSGTYTLAGQTLIFTFGDEAGGQINATLADGVIAMTYQGTEMSFLKKVSYVVTFESNGGSAVAEASVVNGKTVSKPEDPTLNGHAFIGWYADSECTKLFSFDTAITGNVTLYAFWVEEDPNEISYKVSLDLNYAGANDIEGTRTIGGKLYNLPTPVREGYTFEGWWISMYEDGSKLAYPYDSDVVIAEDTTLFAKWTEVSTSSKLSAPVAYVDGDAIKWTRIVGISTYKLEVTGPDGFEAISLDTGATRYGVDFSSAPAGEYVIKVTAIANDPANNSDTTEVYYKNKALAKVSKFSVNEESATLSFNAVANAQRYIISFVCGDDYHDHTEFDNGNSTTFDFANCPMVEGGIQFTVTAVADGYMSSISKSYTYNKVLDAVTGLTLDESAETLTWNAVANATNYILSIKCGDVTYTVDNGSKTSYSLKEYAPVTGGIVISVYAQAAGYNASEAQTVTYNKSTIAAPGGLSLVNMTLSWTKNQDATSYSVKVGDTVLTTSTNSIDLSKEAINWTVGTNYELSVKANGISESAWSETLEVCYKGMNALAYKQSFVSWSPVLGATSYQVKVNNSDEVTTVTDGATATRITLTQAGNNTVYVRAYDGTEYTDWKSVEVFAYTVNFYNGENEKVATQYKAEGDLMDDLYTAEAEGHVLAGWYRTSEGPANNGAMYADKTYSEMGDVELYAYWVRSKYTIHYDYATGSGLGLTQEVEFGKDFELEIPIAPNDGVAFAGWYAFENGAGVQYTDDKGMSVRPWNESEAEDVTVYAYWVEVLSFKETKGGYAVTKGLGISLVSSVKIPATYNGEKVVVVDGYAFSQCTGLKKISIPNTVTTIEVLTAFNNCVALEEIEIYEVEGVRDAVYYSVDGILIYCNPITQQTELRFCPVSKTGTFTVPEGVTEIPLKLFSGTQISEVVIPTSVVTIQASAFYNCPNLTKVTFETGEDQQTLTIAAGAFEDCTALETITIPVRAEDFNTGIFEGCTALKAINVESGHKNYVSIDGVLCTSDRSTIVYCPTAKSGKYVVPAGITAIGENAFAGCAEITEVVFHGFMQTIGENAFAGCTNLTSITFEASLMNFKLSIGDNAFNGATALKTITFEAGSNVTAIGASAFEGVALTNVVIPATVTSIGDRAFAGNVVLTKVTFGADGAKVTLGEYIFQDCTVLSEVELSVGVSNFNSNIFDGCDSMTAVSVAEDNTQFTASEGVLFDKDITQVLYYPSAKVGNYKLPDSVTVIKEDLFKDSNFTSITIGKNVTKIGSNAFSGSTKLTEVIFEEGGTEDLEIAASAFKGCIEITSIKLPARVKSISNSTFDGCVKLATVTFEGEVTSIGGYAFRNTALTSITLSNTLETIGGYAFAGCFNLETVNIPDSVTSLGSSAFADSALTSVTIGTGITVIREKTFSNCTDLNTVSMSDNVTAIEKSAFEGCVELDTITLSKTLATIGEKAFYDCKTLGSFTVSETVTAIGENAFAYAAGLSELLFEGGEAELTIGNKAFYNCSALTAVALPERLTTLGDDVFGACPQLTEVTITGDNSAYVIQDGILYSKDMTTIYRTLEKLSGDVTIPKSVTKIEAYAFKGSNIKALIFEEGGTELAIGNYAFSYAGITSLTLPKHLTAIGTYAFEGIAITELDLPEGIAITEPDLPEGSLPKGLTELGDYSFQDNWKLKTVNIPASVTKLGDYAFSDCSSLTGVNFAEDSKMESLGRNAFSGCTKLTSIDLPSSITNFGTGYTFVGCTSLESLVLPAGLTKNDFSYLVDGCTSLTSITWAENVDYADGLGTTPNLAEIIVPEANTYIKNYNGDGVVYSKDGKTLKYYPIGRTGEYVVPEGVTTFSSYVFKGNTGLTSVTIAGSVTALSIGLFQNASNLQTVTFAEGTAALTINSSVFEGTAIEEITLPARLTTMLSGNEFKNCTKLVKVTFEEGCKLTRFGLNTFVGCTALTTVENIPAAVTTFGNYMFKDCASLESVDIPKDSAATTLSTQMFINSGLKSFVFPDNITNTGSTTFSGCTRLESVTLNDKLATIDGSAFKGCTALTSISLPASVKTITANAFQNSGLTSIEIPLAVTTINDYTFDGCKSLTSITIPRNVTKLGNYVFRNSGLTSIEIPETVTSLGTNVFQGCVDLTSVTLSSKLKSLGNYTFEGCTSLTGVTLPTDVTSIGTNAFQNSGITSFEAHDGLKTIGNYAFSGAKSLASVTFSDTVTSIGSYAFENCTSLTGTFTVPGNVTTIGSYAFIGCTGITGIELGVGVKSIGDGAFSGCTALTDLFIPNTVTTIGAAPFFGSSVNVSVATDNTGFRAVDGVLYSSDMTKLISYPMNKEGDFTVPARVTEIGANAFTGSAVTSVKILGNVTEIAESTFENCKNLTKIELPDSLTKIGANAFRNSGLKSVKIGANVSMVGTYAFDGCTDLATVEIAANDQVKLSLDEGAFRDCKSLTSITLPRRVRSTTETRTELDNHGQPEPKTVALHGIGAYCFSGCINLKTVNFEATGAQAITDKLTIGNHAFENCISLTSIALPDTVGVFTYQVAMPSTKPGASPTYSTYYEYVAIGDYAFSGCTNLGEVTFGFTVTTSTVDKKTEFGKYAFDGCAALSAIELPDNIVTLPEGFLRGTGLVNVTIPVSYKYINTRAFENCVKMESITVLGDVKSIAEYTYAGCTDLESVTYAVNAFTGVYEGAFQNCTSLSNFALSSTVTQIGAKAFENCTALAELRITAAVANLSEGAFAGWTEGQKIYFVALEGAMGNWNEEWNAGCNAELIWNAE